MGERGMSLTTRRRRPLVGHAEQLCKKLAIDLTDDQRAAVRILEHLGAVFCVDFGIDNAAQKADEAFRDAPTPARVM